MKLSKKFFALCLSAAAIAGASTVNVDVGEEHQVIRGFGGMVHNTWQGGAGLSEADAKIAFGTGDGTLGLNTLRIPVYASSNDFNKEVQAAKWAKKYAGDDFILYATPWTSPYAGANQHMASSNYQKYVDHLNNFNDYMKNQGVPLYAISISNEPDWCGEWACWSADEIYNFTKGYADKMRKNGAKVISTESFAYQKKLYDNVLNDANALKNWDILGAHFYASEANTADSWFAYSLADQKKVERWMTEHYTESQGSGNYWRHVMVTGDQANAAKRDTVRAMDVGYEIHRAMVVGNFSQYTWWYIRRCYGLIMEKDFGNKLQVNSNEIGKISKRGYVLSQFARFVRPGAIRVGATAKPEANVFASAYKSADGDSTIVVLVNRDYGNAKTVTVNIKGADVKTVHMYTTSESKNAKYEGELDVVNGSVTVKMESGSANKDCIVTLVGVGEQIIIPQEPFGGKAWAIPGKIQMEDFDVPGAGKGNNSYYDNDPENHGDSDYRKDTGVDLYKKSGDRVVVGYNQKDEWLEYTVDVKETGTYTMFAAVASANNTSSFKLSMDGEDITKELAVPAATAGEENYDDYNKVSAEVKLTKGQHILRFTVTGDWMDIDYINFVAGAGADDTDPIVKEDEKTDPETPGNTEGGEGEGNTDDGNSTGIVNAKFLLSSAPVSFEVYSLTGEFLGNIKAMAQNSDEIKSKTLSLVKRGGVYLVKSENGSMQRISVMNK